MGYLRFYHIQEEYIAYLHRVDRRVQFNKSERRPYVGIVLKVNGHNYYVPLESPKPNHANIKSNGPILKLDEGRLGIMGFNNMVPVKSGQLIDFDIVAMTDKTYQTLLLKQLHYCAKNKGIIERRAINTYTKQIGGNNPFYERVCCDFRSLEAACRRYNPNWKPKTK